MSDCPVRDNSASSPRGRRTDDRTRLAANEFSFSTRWRVFGSIRDVADVMCEVGGIPRWWPAFGVAVEILNSGERDGSGKVVCVCSIGLLRQARLWQFRVVEARYPWSFSIEAWGDTSGRGTMCFKQNGPWVDATCDWTIRVDHSAARILRRLLRPFLQLRFRWVMGRGEEGLCLELARRRAASTRESASSSRSSRPTGVIDAHADLLKSPLRCEW